MAKFFAFGYCRRHKHRYTPPFHAFSLPPGIPYTLARTPAHAVPRGPRHVQPSRSSCSWSTARRPHAAAPTAAAAARDPRGGGGGLVSVLVLVVELERDATAPLDSDGPPAPFRLTPTVVFTLRLGPLLLLLPKLLRHGHRIGAWCARRDRPQ